MLIRCYHIAFETWAAVFCLIAAFAIYPARVFDRNAAKSCIALLLVDFLLNVAEVTGWACVGWTDPGVHTLAGLAHFTVFLCAYSLIICMAWHMSAVIKTRGGTGGGRLVTISVLLSFSGILLVAASRIFGGIYTLDSACRFIRLGNYGASIIIAGIALLPLLILTVRNRSFLRKREYAVFLFICLFPEAGLMLQFMFDRISFYNVADSVCLILLILVHQLEYTSDVVERERQRAAEQIGLYTRQIQPHFIYNSLSTIRSYLPEGSEAWESLNHFAGFLRGSIDLLTAEGCIEAEREFETVMEYLYMEKERFGDDLTIETDIRDREFMIPAFTLQTLVENAIRHGIRRNPDGRGTLSVRSKKSGGYIS